MSDVSSVYEEQPVKRPMSTPIASSKQVHERTRLLFEGGTTATHQPEVHGPPRQDHSQTWHSRTSELIDDDPTLSFVGLNALEIATVAGAKRFLSQHVVQHVINAIWAGDIIFWESLSIHTRKTAQLYHQKY